MTQLVAEGLGVVHGDRLRLDGIQVAAGPGEFIAVIGPNGSGKSTLLAALAGLLPVSTGAVRWQGEPVARIPPQRLAQWRAYLPQNARCEWPLTVERMVALGLAPWLPAFGRESADVARRVTAVLADFDLLAQRDRPVTRLSGGELARAMLARALVGDPRVLVVDEPLAGLDPRHAWDAAHRLRDLAITGGRLVIASLHDLNVAMRCATRVWALRDGRLVADGPPATAVTSAVLEQLFDVPACVSGQGGRAYVDFAPRESRTPRDA